MSTNISVRPVTQSDHDEWLTLWEGYNTFYVRAGETALSSEIIQMTWSRFFDAYEPVHGIVAESNGKLVGLAHYIFHRSTISITPVCYLQDLFTATEERGKGIARALINEVHKQAALAGSPRLYWQTHETNATAMRLYDKVAERSGFIVYRMMI